MKKIIFLVVFLVSNLTFSQILNQYKYAIVPEKYSFQKSKNDYNLNELTKAAMRKYGFEPYFETEILPKDISNENKFYVDVLENSSIIYTKLTIVLRDYTNNVLFRSAEGKSKEKDFAEAYEECFRQAIKSFDQANFIQKMNSQFPVKADVVKMPDNKPKPSFYIAKIINNGYDLSVENQFKFILKNSSKKEIFIATKNFVTGLVMKIDDEWFFEYYINENLVLEKINIVFQ